LAQTDEILEVASHGLLLPLEAFDHRASLYLLVTKREAWKGTPVRQQRPQDCSGSVTLQGNFLILVICHRYA
jgi:hypothetical protein